MISGVAASIGRPERGALYVDMTTFKFIHPIVHLEKIPGITTR